MPKFVVLQVQEEKDSTEVKLTHVAPQVVEYASLEEAAEMLGRLADDLDVPTRIVVVPWRNWHEFEVYLESVKGTDQYSVYRSENPSIGEA